MKAPEEVLPKSGSSTAALEALLSKCEATESSVVSLHQQLVEANVAIQGLLSDIRRESGSLRGRRASLSCLQERLVVLEAEEAHHREVLEAAQAECAGLQGRTTLLVDRNMELNLQRENLLNLQTVVAKALEPAGSVSDTIEEENEEEEDDDAGQLNGRSGEIQASAVSASLLHYVEKLLLALGHLETERRCGESELAAFRAEEVRLEAEAKSLEQALVAARHSRSS